MNNLLLLLWIVVYSFSGVTIFLSFWAYQRRRDTKVLGFLYILTNNFLVAVVTLASILLELATHTFLFLVFDTIVLYYLTVPYLILQYIGAKALYRRILLFVLIGIGLCNLLVILVPDALYMLYYAYPAPLIALFVFAFFRARKGALRSLKIQIFKFWKSVANCVVFMIVLALILSAGYTLIALLFPGADPVVQGVYFALVIFLYNVPAVLLFINLLRTPLPSTCATPDWDAMLKELKLSPREREVALLLMDGKKYEDIGKELFVTLSTIKRHVYSIYQKTKVNNSRQLMQKVMDLGGIS